MARPSSSAEERAITLDTIQKIESKISMPSGTRGLASYARYYTTYPAKGSLMLSGVFVLEAAHSGVHIVKSAEMPIVSDGGCLVVNLKYNLSEERVIDIFCNGVA
jgi:hypothetical protein